ncbi:MAG: hypothetical protein ACHQZS_00205 [Candidatus Binatales bacterium]
MTERDRRRIDALADALADALNRSGLALEKWLASCFPGYDRRVLEADYEANGELWVHFCGFALDLAGFNPAASPTARNSLSESELAKRGWRTVSVEEVARIVVVLFWFTLLISHGFFAPVIDTWRWNALPEPSRRKWFRWLCGFLHLAVARSGETNPAPARRAAYEIASLLVPNIARTYEQDREAQKQFERWQRKHRPARNVQQKPTQ